MVFWRAAPAAQPAAPSAATAGTEQCEETPADVDEPPNELPGSAAWNLSRLHSNYVKNIPHPGYQRRESLLTRQLHWETEHSDEDSHPHPSRALSTQSTWSSQSTTSTAELTSDDGKSMASPAISPPLPPTHIRNGLLLSEKPLDKKVEILGQEVAAVPEAKMGGVEKSVEATLGRKRCIMFACGGKDKAKAPPAPTVKEPEKPAVATSPVKRKCMIKFACPTKAAANAKPDEKSRAKRPVSPPPNEPRSSAHPKLAHRGSDSTVTHISPRSVRRNSNNAQTPTATTIAKPVPSRKLSNDSDDNATEALRFHEFASSDDEPEEWCQESTCHRSRLTVDDTLKKELVIRKACEEVEEEAIEEDEAEAEDEMDDVDPVDDDQDEDEDQQEDDDESEGSDAGFHSDDEEGFAASDSEGGDSDYEWWKPGGSTAATSVEHLDRLNIQSKQSDGILGTSIGSVSSGHLSPRSSRHHFHHHSPERRKRISRSIPIAKQQPEADLPDSTDFVCGTLDEDRPIEQAYINRKKDLEAAKHKLRPQDIDPSFPTSDPEMDEEDDEDLEDPEESEEDDMMHGGMEELHGRTDRRRPSPAPKRTSIARRSPPPPARHHSPPPPSKRRAQHPSPPPAGRRGTARSPPPRKLFGHSPRHINSPVHGNRMTSPPNTRRSSPSGRGVMPSAAPLGLAERPITHTASLPRGGFLLSTMGRDDSVDSSMIGTPATDVPKRGAIDIVKGLEKKRQRRKEKMWQKMCAKNAAKGEKAYKVKPGKGAERMREVGLELQRYHGKGEHILSV